MRRQVWAASHCPSSACSKMSPLCTALCGLGRCPVVRGRGSFSPSSSGSFQSVWGEGELPVLGIFMQVSI